jgi:hypothetical protein
VPLRLESWSQCCDRSERRAVNVEDASLQYKNDKRYIKPLADSSHGFSLSKLWLTLKDRVNCTIPEPNTKGVPDSVTSHYLLCEALSSKHISSQNTEKTHWKLRILFIPQMSRKPPNLWSVSEQRSRQAVPFFLILCISPSSHAVELWLWWFLSCLIRVTGYRS